MTNKNICFKMIINTIFMINILITYIVVTVAMIQNNGKILVPEVLIANQDQILLKTVEDFLI